MNALLLGLTVVFLVLWVTKSSSVVPPIPPNPTVFSNVGFVDYSSGEPPQSFSTASICELFVFPDLATGDVLSISNLSTQNPVSVNLGHGPPGNFYQAATSTVLATLSTWTYVKTGVDGVVSCVFGNCSYA